MIAYGIFGAVGLAALAYLDVTNRLNDYSSRTSTLEETYEALVGSDGSLITTSDQLLATVNSLQARQDIICDQVQFWIHAFWYYKKRFIRNTR